MAREARRGARHGEVGQSGDLQQLADLADELLEQAGALRRQCLELVDTLDQAGAAEPAPARAAHAVDETSPIRLIAFDMARAGSSRTEVDQYLRQTFGVGDSAKILDEVFGESGAGG